MCRGEAGIYWPPFLICIIMLVMRIELDFFAIAVAGTGLSMFGFLTDQLIFLLIGVVLAIVGLENKKRWMK